jgi:hypothetical protein
VGIIGICHLPFPTPNSPGIVTNIDFTTDRIPDADFHGPKGSRATAEATNEPFAIQLSRTITSIRIVSPSSSRSHQFFTLIPSLLIADVLPANDVKQNDSLFWHHLRREGLHRSITELYAPEWIACLVKDNQFGLWDGDASIPNACIQAQAMPSIIRGRLFRI